MPGRIRSRLLLLATAAAVVGALAVGTAAAAASEVVYSNIPAKLAGNYASVGAEAYSYVEFGGGLELAGTKRNKPTVEVVMSTWACQFGTWYEKTCETPSPQKTVKIPMTVKLYEVGEKNVVGEKLGEVTHSFKMPYRPSEDHTNCPSGERWYDSQEKTCYHGFAFKLKFPPVNVLRMPKKVVVGLSYNTSHYGPAPLGDHNECNAKSAGCYYDSLNVGLAEPSEKLLTTGADFTEPYIHIATANGEACGNETEAEAKFAPSECPTFWEGDQPLIQVTAK